MVDLSNYTGLAFLAPVLLFFQQFRDFLKKLLGLFVKTRKIPFSFCEIFYRNLKDKSFILDLDNYWISEMTGYHVKEAKEKTIFLKLNSFEIAFYKWFIPIFISPVGPDENGFTIRYFKFTFDFEKHLNEALQEWYENRDVIGKFRDNFYIQEFRGTSLKKLSEARASSTISVPPSEGVRQSRQQILTTHDIFKLKLDCLFLHKPDEVLYQKPKLLKDKYVFTEIGENILKEVESWLAAESWYKGKRIVWRRGTLLNGKPGQGKSSLIFEIGRRAGIPIYIFDLSSYDNQEFCSALEGLSENPAIILFEDIDSVFNLRDNVSKTDNFGGLTFDCFINRLSGVNSIKNKFVFITTNHIDKIDPALMRAGRIDSVIQLKSLNSEEQRRLASIILEDCPSLIERVLADGKEDTTAEFENRCVSLALEKFWDKHI